LFAKPVTACLLKRLSECKSDYIIFIFRLQAFYEKILVKFVHITSFGINVHFDRTLVKK